MVISVEEGSVTNESRHLKPLVHNFEATALINRDNCDFLVVCCQYFLIALEKFNKLIRKDSIDPHFTDRERDIVCPLLKDY